MEEYETNFLFCPKSVKLNEKEASIGIIWKKSLFPLYSINHNQEMRTICIFNEDIV